MPEVTVVTEDGVAARPQDLCAVEPAADAGQEGEGRHDGAGGRGRQRPPACLTSGTCRIQRAACRAPEQVWRPPAFLGQGWTG